MGFGGAPDGPMLTQKEGASQDPRDCATVLDPVLSGAPAESKFLVALSTSLLRVWDYKYP